MSYRKHQTIQREEGRVSVIIAYSNEYQEYRCRLNIDGCDQQGADYFTDDLQDAKLTAASMADAAAAQLTHTTRKLEFTMSDNWTNERIRQVYDRDPRITVAWLSSVTGKSAQELKRILMSED